MTFEIVVYERENGSIPFMEFLKSLSPKMKAKILRDLDLLEDKGNTLREPYSKHLEDGIFQSWHQILRGPCIFSMMEVELS